MHRVDTQGCFLRAIKFAIRFWMRSFQVGSCEILEWEKWWYIEMDGSRRVQMHSPSFISSAQNRARG